MNSDSHDSEATHAATDESRPPAHRGHRCIRTYGKLSQSLGQSLISLREKRSSTNCVGAGGRSGDTGTKHPDLPNAFAVYVWRGREWATRGSAVAARVGKCGDTLRVSAASPTAHFIDPHYSIAGLMQTKGYIPWI